jgi:predicted transcriptional regulator
MTSEAGTRTPRLHELEAEVMEEVWRLGSAKVRDVLDALNARSPRQRAYTTVMTILGHLHRKGFVDRTKAGKRYVYAPRVSREEYLDGRARAEVQALVAECGDVALAHFSRAVDNLGPDQRAALQRLSIRA